MSNRQARIFCNRRPSRRPLPARATWFTTALIAAFIIPPQAQPIQADARDASMRHPSKWTRVIQGGLGDPQVRIITPLIEFKDSLYAGGHKRGGCRIFRSGDGEHWETVVGTNAATPDGFGNANNESINAFAVLDDWLYAGTWNDVNGGEVWRTRDGIAWEAIVGGGAATANGFGKLENSGVTSLAMFGGALFAGTSSLYCKDGVELWRFSETGRGWEAIAGERIALQTALARESKYFLSMERFNDALYLGTGDQRTGGSEIWRSKDGTNWEAVIGAPSAYRAGMGNPSLDMIYDLTTFKDHLYAAVLSFTHEGGALWRSPEGTTWEVIVGDERSPYPAGFGEAANIGLVSLEPFNNALYASTTNEQGTQIWMSEDGERWQRIVGPDAATPSGFGNPNNRSTNKLYAFKGKLYAATDNPKEGGELWQFDPPERSRTPHQE